MEDTFMNINIICKIKIEIDKDKHEEVLDQR